MPADYTVECSDEMPMDDATASDNCGEVTIEVSSETTPATQRAATPSFARSRPPTMRATLLPQTITVQDTTAPEFTFVPADYTVECSDEMPMDDATASDNCGEVTIEVSASSSLATQRATTPSFAPSLRRTMRTATSATQTITVKTPRLLSSLQCQPTTP